MLLEFPLGPVPLNSPFYVKRPPIEAIACEEIRQPGSVIRIKAPKYTGKSSLLLRIIDFARSQGYQIVNIDFRQADTSIFTSIEKFLRWFCANVTRQLNLEFLLDDYWDEEIGSKVSSTIYFQGYLLEQIEVPLVLTLREVNVLFEYPQIAQDFFPLLRSWHDEAKQDEILQKLRLIVVHNTEVYIPLNIHQSPFNIGLPIKLPDFTLEQVEYLAQIHGLNWTNNGEAEKLMAMVGGHPYLVRLALYHLVNNPENSLEQLLEDAPKITGIYHSYLREHLETLQNARELCQALDKVINSQESVEIDHLRAYKLESMGLVKSNGNQCTLSCELYRRYFQKQNLVDQTLSEIVVQLQQQNLELKQLCRLDELTQLANRGSFEVYLKEVWQKLAEEREPLSLIILDIDYFKIYNQSQGEDAGDNCLEKIASSLRLLHQISENFIARYRDDELVVVLPYYQEEDARQIAEMIRERIKNLKIHHLSRFLGLPAPFITVSCGVSSLIPLRNLDYSILVDAAIKALIASKREGRDRVSFHHPKIP
jgi:diguanylate cyclase (GGDEF)-like protein